MNVRFMIGDRQLPLCRALHWRILRRGNFPALFLSGQPKEKRHARLEIRRAASAVLRCLWN